MALPPFYDFCLPILNQLVETQEGLKKPDLYSRVAFAMGLTAADLAETIPSGQSTFENRVGWALSHMKAVDWVVNPKRAHWQALSSGTARAAAGTAVTVDELRPKSQVNPAALVPVVSGAAPVLTPREKIDAARDEILADVEATVLQRLAAVQPQRFESIVLRLLSAMGYAGSLGTSDHAGQSGDGGIDGILYLDRLHLERVYVQAKRWKAPVGASVVRDFAGAMDGESATKGVILTTSSFTPESRKYVEKSPKAIRLVGGQELARLMVEFDVGAQPAVIIKIPRVDEDFFEDG